MKKRNATQDATIDLAELDRDGSEVEDLSKALKQADTGAALGSQFVASGDGKSEAKPSH